MIQPPEKVLAGSFICSCLKPSPERIFFAFGSSE